MCKYNSVDCPIAYLKLDGCTKEAIVTPCECDEDLGQLELDIIEYRTEHGIDYPKR